MKCKNKRRKIISIMGVIGMVGIISLSGCGGNNGVSVEDIDDIVSDVTYLMNIRYNGFIDSDKEEVDRIIPEEYSSKVSNSLKVSNEPIFISLESEFKDIESNYVEEEVGDGEYIITNTSLGQPSDPNIVEVGGERGIYSNRIYVNENGRFVTQIYGNSLYIDAPQEVIIQSLIGDGSYKFECVGYNYYDNNELVIRYQSDLDGAFDELYKDVKVIEGGEVIGDNLIDDTEMDFDATELIDKGVGYKQVTPELYDELKDDYINDKVMHEVSIKVRVSVDGKISDIEIEKITGVLE